MSAVLPWAASLKSVLYFHSVQTNSLLSNQSSFTPNPRWQDVHKVQRTWIMSLWRTGDTCSSIESDWMPKCTTNKNTAHIYPWIVSPHKHNVLWSPGGSISVRSTVRRFRSVMWDDWSFQFLSLVLWPLFTQRWKSLWTNWYHRAGRCSHSQQQRRQKYVWQVFCLHWQLDSEEHIVDPVPGKPCSLLSVRLFLWSLRFCLWKHQLEMRSSQAQEMSLIWCWERDPALASVVQGLKSP